MMASKEQNYCVTRKVMVVIIKAVKHYGKRFLIRKYHASLSWLMRLKQPTGKLA